jgi:hypothetical protein
LFDITLDRPDIVRHLPVAREPRKAPVILSPEEVARMLEAAPGVKYKAALSMAYCAGPVAAAVVKSTVARVRQECLSASSRPICARLPNGQFRACAADPQLRQYPHGPRSFQLFQACRLCMKSTGICSSLRAQDSPAAMLVQQPFARRLCPCASPWASVGGWGWTPQKRTHGHG